MIFHFAYFRPMMGTIFFREYFSQFHELLRIYIKKYSWHGKSIRYSLCYSPWYEGGKIDNNRSLYRSDGPDMIMNGLRYKRTPGLYELLFKTPLIGDNQEDEEKYLDILKGTNVLPLCCKCIRSYFLFPKPDGFKSNALTWTYLEPSCAYVNFFSSPVLFSPVSRVI